MLSSMSAIELERAAHDLVGRRLEHAALGVGARVHAEHMAAGRHDLARAGLRIGDDDPRVVERRVLRVGDRAARLEVGDIRRSHALLGIDDGEAEPQPLAVIDDCSWPPRPEAPGA